ncbi:MAG: ABC transporter permease [Cyclobacteriaceae bacterium]|jgi:putative ABC transport system permease protein
MIRNYFTIALRSFSRQKVYTFINISGLAIGLAGALLIFGYIVDELSYDSIHPFSENTYRVGTQRIFEDGDESYYPSSPALWSSQLKEQNAEVQSVLHTMFIPYPTSVNYKEEDKILLTEKLIFVEKNFPDILYFDVIQGDRSDPFKEVNAIALSESTTVKIFGNEDPIGRILTIKHPFATSDKEVDVMVTAVYKDYPGNSHIDPDYLVNMEALRSVIDWSNFDDLFTGWLRGFMGSYVVFKDGADTESAKHQLESLVYDNLGDQAGNFVPFFKRLDDLYFDKEVQWIFEGSGDISYIYIFGSIAVLLIVIASINYMNLATARSTKRSREVGLRKVMGSNRSKLIFQFIIESFLTTLLSLVLSILLAILILPVFNTLAQKDFVIISFFNLRLLGGMAIIIFLVSILAGSYPALYLSKFKPVVVLRGGKLSSKGSNPLRKILVVFQFSITFFLLICTGVLMKQINFLKSSKLNEQGKQTLSIRYGGNAPIEKFSAFKNTVLQDPTFSYVTMANHLPRLDYFGGIGIEVKVPEVSDQDYQWSELSVDYDFPKAFDLELLAGRDFNTDNPADSNSCLVNEAAVRNLGIDLTEAIGLTIEDLQTQRITKVIGVVKDFPYRSMHHTIGPLRVSARPHSVDQIVYVSLPAENVQDQIQKLESKWKEVFPGIGFDYWFLDQEFGRMYESESRMSDLTESFSIVAIFIACLGLFGLASYMTEQRTKEIGIRKVMGATVKQILVLFLSIFLKMLIISALVAGPIAFYLINEWLLQFAYHISIDWTIIASAIGIVFGITILTVSYELIKASTANPVNAIRYE